MFVKKSIFLAVAISMLSSVGYAQKTSTIYSGEIEYSASKQADLRKLENKSSSFTVVFNTKNILENNLNANVTLKGTGDILHEGTAVNGSITFEGVIEGDYAYDVVYSGYKSILGVALTVDMGITENVTMEEQMNITPIRPEIVGFGGNVTFSWMTGANLAQWSGDARTPANFSETNTGYGVVFDMSEFKNVSFVDLDFYYEIVGGPPIPFDAMYEFILFDVDNNEIIYTSEEFLRPDDTQWVKHGLNNFELDESVSTLGVFLHGKGFMAWSMPYFTMAGGTATTPPTKYSYSLNLNTLEMALIPPSGTNSRGEMMINLSLLTDDGLEIKGLSSYEVFLDGTLQGTTISRDFLFEGLVDGYYTAGVRSVFETGTSATTTINFQVDLTEIIGTPNNLKIEVEGDAATLTWGNFVEHELSHWSGDARTPANFSETNTGYGVVFDLSEYGDVLISDMDFYYEIVGGPPIPFDAMYEIILFDVDKEEIIFISEEFLRPEDTQWVSHNLGDFELDADVTTLGVFLHGKGFMAWSMPYFTMAGGTASTPPTQHSYSLNLNTLEMALIPPTGANSRGEMMINLSILSDAGYKKLGDNKALQHFEVFLNDQYYGMTIEKMYEFIDLDDGVHKAGVRSVYQSATTETASIEFEVVLFPKPQNVVATKDILETKVDLVWQAPEEDDELDLECYIIYRFLKDTPPSQWTVLNDNVSGLTYTDNTFGALPGYRIYQYAVRAKYEGDLISGAVRSNDVTKGLEYHYQIDIATNSNDPATGAIVTLTNVTDPTYYYEAISGPNGVLIENVWAGSYNIKISLTGFETHKGTATVITPGESYIATLIEIKVPLHVAATLNEDDVIVEWWNILEFRYESGIPTGTSSGWDPAAPNSVVGSAWRNANTELISMEWYSLATSGKVGVGVYGLNAQGMPINNVLYLLRNVDSNPNAWTTYEFPERVSVSANGFFLALLNSETMSQSLGFAQPTEDYPFIRGVSWMGAGLAQWTPNLVDIYYETNFLIRGKGIDLSQDDKSGKTLINYTVYRLIEGQPESSWTTLASNLTSRTFIDDWSALPGGNSYQYAVRAYYTSGPADPMFSKPKYKMATYTVTVKANNNEYGEVEGGGDFIEGTSATIKATPKEGYEFVNWVEEGGGEVATTQFFTFPVVRNITLIANFRQPGQKFNVTITISPEDAGKVAGAGEYNAGEKVTVMASPNQGYKFTGWEMDGDIIETDTTLEFFIDQDVDLVAYFGEVGINKHENVPFTIYPNPVRDELRITNYELRDGLLNAVEVFDIYGRLIKSDPEINSGVNLKSEIVIDVSKLSPGQYIIRLTDNKTSVTQMFIKK